MELGQRIKQLLLIEVKSLLSHKDFMEQVYYSPVNRIPKLDMDFRPRCTGVKKRN